MVVRHEPLDPASTGAPFYGSARSTQSAGSQSIPSPPPIRRDEDAATTSELAVSLVTPYVAEFHPVDRTPWWRRRRRAVVDDQAPTSPRSTRTDGGTIVTFAPSEPPGVNEPRWLEPAPAPAVETPAPLDTPTVDIPIDEIPVPVTGPSRSPADDLSPQPGLDPIPSVWSWTDRPPPERRSVEQGTSPDDPRPPDPDSLFAADPPPAIGEPDPDFDLDALLAELSAVAEIRPPDVPSTSPSTRPPAHRSPRADRSGDGPESASRSRRPGDTGKPPRRGRETDRVAKIDGSMPGTPTSGRTRRGDPLPADASVPASRGPRPGPGPISPLTPPPRQPVIREPDRRRTAQPFPWLLACGLAMALIGIAVALVVVRLALVG